MATRRGTFPAIALLNAGRSSFITLVNCLFAAVSACSICESTSSDASVGRESVPPATSPAPLGPRVRASIQRTVGAPEGKSQNVDVP